MNRNGPHRLIDFNAWSPESSTNRRCNLGEVGVAMLKKPCHSEGGFPVSNAQAGPSGSRYRTLG